MTCLKDLVSGVLSGVMISIGGSVFLATDNKIAGAILFCVALLCICLRGYSLFTGKVGFIPKDHSKAAVSALLLGLLGNLFGTVACGYLMRLANMPFCETAVTVCNGKLAQSIVSCLVRAMFCGVLMYMAVSVFREKKSVIGILFCIPVFILSGFEHSVADLFYFAASGIVSLKAFGYLWLVIAGNAIGAMVMCLGEMLCEKAKEDRNAKQ